MENKIEEPKFFEMANSKLLFIVCGVVILLVFVQALLFMRQSYKRGLELGVDKKRLNKVIVSSGVFSIVPSIPILISYVTIMKSMGKYFPWLRLSVVGSATYEYIAADRAAKAMNFTGITDLNITNAAFIGIMLVITLCILGGPIMAVISTKRIEKMTKEGVQKKESFASKVPGAMFAGMLCTLIVPHFLFIKAGEDSINLGSDPTGIVVLLFSGAAVLLLEKIAKKSGIRALTDFAFPLAMLLGMGLAILLHNVMPTSQIWASR